MAILSIPETVPAQQANRGPDSSSSLPDNEKENQHLHHVESGSVPQNKAVTKRSTEFWIVIINFLSYVILMVAILVDRVSLSSVQQGTLTTMLGPFFVTFIPIVLAAHWTGWLGVALNYIPPMATYTTAFLLLCLICTGVNFGRGYNNNKEEHNSIQEPFTYESKPATYSSASDSNHFYDISATMNNNILSSEGVKEFLKKYDCDKNRFPTSAIQHLSIFGSMGTFGSYPVINLICDNPVKLL